VNWMNWNVKIHIVLKKVKDLRSQNSEDEPGRVKAPDQDEESGDKEAASAIQGDEEDIITDAFE